MNPVRALGTEYIVLESGAALIDKLTMLYVVHIHVLYLFRCHQ